MTDSVCPYESIVVESARTGDWENGLRAHVRGCAACAEAARVTEWMSDFAAYFGRRQSAPDPTFLWLKAEIERCAKVEYMLSWRRVGIVVLLGLAGGLVGAAAIVAALPVVSAVADVAVPQLSSALAAASLIDRTAVATLWLGLPLVLIAIYVLVLRQLQ